MKTFSTALAILMFATTPSALALSATQSVLKEIQSTTPSGDIETRYVEAKLVIPGETVVYRLDYENDQSEPVTDMILTMPVPAEVIFQDGSAELEGMKTYFSTDGGTIFQPRSELMAGTGDGIRVPASSEDITHIRWEATTSFPVAARGQLQFKAVLK